jgi:hypothetical protein
MMNMRFKEFMNKMVGLRTNLASHWDGLICKDLECRRSMRRVISPSEEFIAQNIDEKYSL